MNEFILDLNQIASRESVLIPEGTYIKVSLAIRPGGCGPDRMLTKAKNSDFWYLNTILVVCSGPFTGRKVYHRFSLQGSSTGYDAWVERGQRQLRAAIESAYRILPTDNSEAAQAKRRLTTFRELEGLTFFVKVGIQAGRDPAFAPSNVVRTIITPDFVAYDACEQDTAPIEIPETHPWP